MDESIRRLSKMKALYPEGIRAEARSAKITVEIGHASLLFSFNRLIGISGIGPDQLHHNFTLGGQHSTQTIKHLNSWKPSESREEIETLEEFEFHVATVLRNEGMRQIKVLQQIKALQQNYEGNHNV